MFRSPYDYVMAVKTADRSDLSEFKANRSMECKDAPQTLLPCFDIMGKLKELHQEIPGKFVQLYCICQVYPSVLFPDA